MSDALPIQINKPLPKLKYAKNKSGLIIVKITSEQAELIENNENFFSEAEAIRFLIVYFFIRNDPLYIKESNDYEQYTIQKTFKLPMYLRNKIDAFIQDQRRNHNVDLNRSSFIRLCLDQLSSYDELQNMFTCNKC